MPYLAGRRNPAARVGPLETRRLPDDPGLPESPGGRRSLPRGIVDVVFLD